MFNTEIEVTIYFRVIQINMSPSEQDNELFITQKYQEMHELIFKKHASFEDWRAKILDFLRLSKRNMAYKIYSSVVIIVPSQKWP